MPVLALVVNVCQQPLVALVEFALIRELPVVLPNVPVPVTARPVEEKAATCAEATPIRIMLDESSHCNHLVDAPI